MNLMLGAIQSRPVLPARMDHDLKSSSRSMAGLADNGKTAFAGQLAAALPDAVPN